ncbi:MAG: serine kinase [Proteobacteria bacterium]|nr:serine kinase [Pseudomonadota bacterium]
MISEIKPGTFHGSCVDFEGKSILAIGPSGCGKSTLALNLVALGGILVSDDQVILSTDANGVIVSPPKTILGQIEARNIGILACPYVDMSRLNLVIDLTETAQCRLPEIHTVKIGAHYVEVIAGFDVANLPIAAKLLNLYGRGQATGSVT